MSTLHPALQILMALGFSIGIVAVLFSPIAIGKVIAKRTNGRVTLGVYAVLAAVAVYGGHDLFNQFGNHFVGGSSYVSMAIFFVPVYIAMGMWIGGDHKRANQEAEKSLEKWRAQLAADRASGSVPQQLVCDYREISALLNKLGRRAEAAEEYRQAMVIMELSMGTHPGMTEFYNGYLALLGGKQNADERARIKSKLELLPKL
jgi:hypothetical protein